MRLVCFALFVAVAAAADQILIYNRTTTPDGWTRADRASADEKLNLFVALKHNDYSRLEERFWAVSDPKSSLWRHFLSKEEITVLLDVSAADTKVVVDFLKSGPDSPEIADWCDALSAVLTVKAAETLFNTTIYRFKNRNGDVIRRAWGPSYLPASVYVAVDFVSRLNNFPEQKNEIHGGRRLQGTSRRMSADAKPNRFVVSRELIFKTYDIPEQEQKKGSSSAAPVEFYPLDYSFLPQDLNDFLALTGAPQRGVDEVVAPAGVNVTDSPTVSGGPLLDLDLLLGAGQAGKNSFYVSKGWMYTFTLELFNRDCVPDVVSVSWGSTDVDDYIAAVKASELPISPEAYETRVNIEFMKLGLRGVSLVVGAGDNGAWYPFPAPCPMDPAFHPIWPGSSPYVTTVGATSVNNSAEYEPAQIPRSGLCAALAKEYLTFTPGETVQCATGGKEHASVGFGSGAGFSPREPRPKYQLKAVEQYLKSTQGLPDGGLYNRSNRAYPDLAAFGELIFLPQTGNPASISLRVGSVVSTPLIGAIVTYLVNRAREYDGKPLGFLNPFLYAMYDEAPGAFNDITVGSSFSECFVETPEGPQFDDSQRISGFPAAPGWDAVTGLGSPVVSKWLAYLDLKLKGCGKDDSPISDASMEPIKLTTGSSSAAMACLAGAAVVLCGSILLVIKRTASSKQPTGPVPSEQISLLEA